MTGELGVGCRQPWFGEDAVARQCARVEQHEIRTRADGAVGDVEAVNFLEPDGDRCRARQHAGAGCLARPRVSRAWQGGHPARH